MSGYLDRSGHGRSLVPSGSVTPFQSGPAALDGAVGLASGGYLESDYAPTGLSAFTVEAWYKGTDTQGVLVTGRLGATQGIRLGFGADPLSGGADGRVHLGVSADSLWIGVYTTSVTINDGTWHHIVGVWTGAAGSISPSQFAIAVDDVVATVGTTAFGSASYPFSTADHIIGMEPGPGIDATGDVAAVALYPTALSGARRSAHYTAASTSRDAYVAAVVADAPGVLWLLDDAGDSEALSIAGTVPTPIMDMTLEVEATVSVAGAIPQPVLDVHLARPLETQTWNRAGGRVRSGYAVLEWNPSIVTPAEGHNLPEGTVVLSDEGDVPFAKAYDSVTIDADGNSVYHGRQTIYGPMLTVRIVIGGRDVTFWRGARTPVPDWQFTEPFGYGPAVFNFEGIGPHEIIGEVADDPDASPHLRDWLYRDAKAKIQLVDHATQTVHSTVWRGQLEDFVEANNNLQVIASGLWSGEAATRWLPTALFGERKDIGQLIWRLSESVAGVRMKPVGGPITGIENQRLGEMKQIEAVNLLLRRAQTRNRGPYTLTPRPWGSDTFRMVEKDTETIDATFYGEGKQVKLQRVRADEADRVFGRGTTPGGQRVRNGRYPGVLDDPDEAIQKADYPYEDGRAFGLGTTNDDVDTDDGISVLLVRMQTYGLLSREDVEPGVVNGAAEGGINRLRFRMGLLLTGLVTPNVWDALFNVGRIGSSIWWSKVEPMAQTNWSIRWNTSADGSILSHHDGFDPDRRIVDKANDYGVWRREQMFDFSDKDLDEQQTPNIFGEVDFSDHGGLLRGSVDPGTTVTDEDFMHQLELRPGMNIRFPFTRWGDIVLRFPTFAITGGSSPSVTGRGSTRPVDSVPLYEALNESKAARKDLEKIWWHQNRSSGKVSDAVGEFEEIGGQINPVSVTGGQYRVIRVLAGQIGMFERFRIRCEPEREFVAAIFGLPIGVGKLESVCPDPLADKQGWIDSMNDLNETHRLLYLVGEPGDPGGYSPGSKSGGHELTGDLDDRSPFPYKTSQPDKFAPWVYLVLFSANDTVFHGGDQGRILWNQELVGQ